MVDDISQLRRVFFRSIEDAGCLLRLFDFLPGVYLYVKDTEGRFVAMNEALFRMRGASQEHELLGKTDVELHPTYWGRRYQEEDRRVMASGKEIPHQVWLVPDADGNLASFVSSKVPLHDARGQCIGVAGVMYRLEAHAASAQRHGRLEAATRLIAQRYDGPLEVRELAAAAGLSPSQLNRRFQATYQLSPSQYLQRIRVHEASRLLAESDVRVGEVAQRTGFYDQAHLSRTFRKLMGMSPRRFRQASRRQREDAPGVSQRRP